LLTKVQELSPQAHKACKILSQNEEISGQTNEDNILDRTDDSDTDEQASSDEDQECAAFTLAVIFNPNCVFEDVTDIWRTSIEQQQRVLTNIRAEDRPASNRIIMDEMAHKSHE